MLNHKFALESILHIEQTFEVNSITYGDWIVWPFIRILLYDLILHDQNEIEDDLQDLSVSKIPILNLTNDNKKSLYKYDNKTLDILFFSRLIKHKEKIDNNFFNIYIDPLIDLLKENYDYIKLEFFEDGYLDTLPRIYPTIFIKPELSCFEEEQTNIYNFSAIQKKIYNELNIYIDENIFHKKLISIKTGQKFFMKILSIISPKIVFLECFYYDTGISLITACKKLNILSVDIQHGFYGKYHGAYTHWTKIPKSGYDLLPDYFWCWGKHTLNNIVKWKGNNSNYNKPVVGGNLRYNRWFNNDPVMNKEINYFYNYLKNYKKVILVTLQGDVSPLPQFFFNAVNLSPKNWIWLIRFHPRMLNEQDKINLINKFHDHNIKNYEMDNATFCPLTGLLKRVDHHITGFSTSAIDALVFNVPTTFIDKTAYERFDDIIKNGVFKCAFNEEDLLRSLNQKFTIDHSIIKQYIETNIDTAKKALKSILNNELYCVKSSLKQNLSDFQNSKNKNIDFQYKNSKNTVNNYKNKVIQDAQFNKEKKKTKSIINKKLCLIYSSCNNRFLNSYYKKNIDFLNSMSYEEQIQTLFDQCVGISNFYSKALKDAGWNSFDFILNDRFLQQKWAKMHSYQSNNNIEIAVQQIQSLKPDVLYLYDMEIATKSFISLIRPYTKLIAGHISFPLMSGIDYLSFDIIFSPYPDYVKILQNNNIKAYYIPHAFCNKISDNNLQKIYPVTFIGDISDPNDNNYKIIEQISSRIPINFWGYGINKLSDNSPLKKYYQGEIWGIEKFLKLSQSQITLNYHCDTDNYAGNKLLFEAAGCKTLLITDFKDNLNDLFEIGKEIIAYRDVEECIDLIKYYLKYPIEADKIAINGQKKTLKEHTYEKRIANMAEIFEKNLLQI